MEVCLKLDLTDRRCREALRLLTNLFDECAATEATCCKTPGTVAIEPVVEFVAEVPKPKPVAETIATTPEVKPAENSTSAGVKAETPVEPKPEREAGVDPEKVKPMTRADKEKQMMETYAKEKATFGPWLKSALSDAGVSRVTMLDESQFETVYKSYVEKFDPIPF